MWTRRGATSGTRGALVSVLHMHPQMVMFPPHSPGPAITLSRSCPSWVMRNNEFICHSFLSSTQCSVFLSLLSAALPLVVGKWTKAPLNRLIHSVKARGLDLSWCGETQFISAPDQLPAKRTSHPISRRLQHKKQGCVSVSACLCVCVRGCWVGGEGLSGVRGRGACGQENPDGF